MIMCIYELNQTNISHSERFFHGPSSVHYGDVLLYLFFSCFRIQNWTFLKYSFFEMFFGVTFLHHIFWIDILIELLFS